MKKKFQKRTLLVAALTMSAMALGNVAKADEVITTITNETELNNFMGMSHQTSPQLGNITQDITLTKDMSGAFAGNVLTIAGDSAPRTISGDEQFKGFRFAVLGAGNSASVKNLIVNDMLSEWSYDNPLGSALTNLGSMHDIGTLDDKITFNDNFTNVTGTGDTSTTAFGGAVLNIQQTGGSTTLIYGIHADFNDNHVKTAGTKNYSNIPVAGGGAIANYANNEGTATIGSITGDFDGNYAEAPSSRAIGGAIANYAHSYSNPPKDSSATIGIISGTFTSNHADGSEAYGGAIANMKKFTMGNQPNAEIGEILRSTFDGNYTKATDSSGAALGGAIYTNHGTTDITDSTFTNNYAQGQSASGGAIYADTDATINLNTSAADKTLIFTDNYTTANGTDKIYNDINNNGTLNINGNISMTGGITGSGTTTIGNVVVKLSNGAKIDQGTLMTADATFDLRNNTIDTIDLRHPSAGSTINFKLDYDGSKAATSTGGNIDYINLTGDEPDSNASVEVKAINVIADGETSSTATWLSSSSKVTDFTASTIKSATSNAIYTFTKSGTGTFDITHKTITDLTLGEIVHDPDYSFITSYSLSDNYNLKSDEFLGDLAGADREFTIFGNGYDINAADSTAASNGINIAAGQTFALNNAAMKGFKNTATDDVQGGVINNAGTITDINADFTGNYAESTSGQDDGGAIYNQGTINGIGTSDKYATFTGNGIRDYDTTNAEVVTSRGGAIYNQGTITNINADFTRNAADYAGGAITNYAHPSSATIENINGTFSENSAGLYGGAIANFAGAATAEIHNIGTEANHAKFEKNFVKSDDNASGGAIYNTSSIDKINADFTGNYAETTATSSKAAGGGAIFNYGNASSIINSIGTENNHAKFENNYTTSANLSTYGGAIWNATNATIKNINADFTGNYAETTGDVFEKALGGAIYNQGTIGYNTNEGGIGTSDTYATFTNNGIKLVGETPTTVTQEGGAIWNSGTITNIYAAFEGNSSANSGGAIYNANTATIANIVGTFTNNESSTGGAIGNYALGNGGSITTLKITEIDADFTGNKATYYGGAIFNKGHYYGQSTISKITGEFKENSAQEGGAIYNYAAHDNATAEIELIDEAIFKDNYATKDGGAIYNSQSYNVATITLKDVIFENNYVTDGTEKTYNDIYNTGTINIIGNVSMTGGISDEDTPMGTTNITNTGTLTLLHAKDEQGTDKGLATLNQGTVKINGGTLSIQNSVGGDELTIENLGVDSGKTANFKIDCDPANSKYDMIYISNDGAGKGSIALTDIKMLSDISDGTSGSLYWAIKDNINPLLNWNDATGTIYSATKDYFYTFTKDSSAGAVYIDTSTGKELISTFDLPSVIQATQQGYEKIWYYKLADNTTLSEALGKLGGKNRELTIDGQGHTMDGNGNQGITVKTGQDFALDNITMKNFTKEATGSAQGAVIYNESGTISSIKNVTFENNKITQSDTDAKLINGGAIANTMGTVGEISGSFNNNSVAGVWSGGGAIWNVGNITDGISSNFTGNYVKSTGTESDPEFGTPEAYGGAIANVVMGSIKSIKGNFSKNYAEATANAYGGAIYNKSASLDPELVMVAKIDSIGTSENRAKFSENYVKSTGNGNACGGAIWNAGTITNIYADFEGNKAIANTDNALGGAIYNEGTIDNISGTFTNNTANAGGAIYNDGSGTINITNSNFEGNKATSAQGGAIAVNNGKVEISNTVFTNNEAGSYGGAIDVRDGKSLIVNNSIFDGNKAATSNGGAINSNGIIEVSNSTFTNNVSTKANGGAIMVYNGTATISDSTFSGNTANGKPNDIHNRAMLTFKGTNRLEGGIADDTTPRGTTNIGDSTTPTTVTLGKNATLQQKEVVLNQNATLALGSRAAAGFLTNVDTFTANGGTLSLQNGSIDVLGFNNLVLNNDLAMMVDADLYNLTMDQISANNYSGSGNILVSNIRLLSDAPATSIGMTFVLNEDGLREKVKYTGEQGISYSPKYKYNVAYDSKTGMFNFTRSGGGNDLNPALYASSVAQQGMYLTQINTYEQAFANMDQIMLMPKAERTAWKMANKYAAENSNNGVISYDPNQSVSGKGVWFRPFASFENVPLNNGPKVDNFSYGGLVGGDSDLIELKHGWDMVWGAYAGYNGSHQKYDGISMYQNGGTLGLNATWYKGDFFTGLTANIGASGAEASTTFGKDNFAMLATGIASKTGYNWELFNSKFIIQPSFLMSYSFINTFDYTSASGVDMHTDPLNAIQLVPGLKFIGNLPKGWQPYIGVSMVWNLLDKTKVTAGDIGLSEMSVDPFIQYGIGVQKRWGDKFTGFGQVMMRNGGRNGVSLNAGFKYELGKSGPKTNSKAGISHAEKRKISLSVK